MSVIECVQDIREMLSLAKSIKLKINGKDTTPSQGKEGEK